MTVGNSRLLFFLWTALPRVLIVLTVGCSNIDMTDGMFTRTKMEEAGPDNTLIQDEAAERDKKLQVLLANNSSVDARPVYHIGADDTLDVSVFALETPGQAKVMRRKLEKDGTFELPWIGKVKALGVTVHDLQLQITEAYRGKYLKDPDVAVSVVEYQSAGVWVTGAVRNPGLHFLKKDRTTILELLASVGGLENSAGKDIVVKRGLSREQQALEAAASTNVSSKSSPAAEEPGKVLKIDIKALYNSGDPRWNITVSSGDYITVPMEKNNFINVLGYVRNPGSFAITADESMTAWRALGKAGGPNDAGRVEMCYIIRESPSGKRKPIQVNVKEIMFGETEDFPMQAGDTLIVGAPLYMKLKDIFSVGGGASYDYAVPGP